MFQNTNGTKGQTWEILQSLFFNVSNITRSESRIPFVAPLNWIPGLIFFRKSK